MTTYFGTNQNDTIDTNKLTSDVDWIDALEGDDKVILRNGTGYIANAGDNTVVGVNEYNSYALWNATQVANINLQTGYVSNNGFGGVDIISNIRTIHTGSKGAYIVGNNLNNDFYVNGGDNQIYGGGGFDTAIFYQQNISNYSINYIKDNDEFVISNGIFTNRLYGISKIYFSDKTIRKTDYYGNFSPIENEINISLPIGSFLSAFYSGDFNGDGNSDLILTPQFGTGTKPTHTLFYLSDGQGNFQNNTQDILVETNINVNTGGRQLIGDFNNDGFSDVFELGFGNDAPPFPGGTNSYYLSSKISGKLVDISTTLSQKLENNHGGCIGDVNNDGYLDIVVNATWPTNGNHLLINDGSGRFFERNNAIPQIGYVEANGHFQNNPANTYSGLVDVNKDGFKDLILGTWQINQNSIILLNDKLGNFNNTQKIILPHSAIYKDDSEESVLDVKPININNDNFPDLMISITSGGSLETYYHAAYIQFLKNNGDGTFEDVTKETLPQSESPDTSRGQTWWFQLTPSDFNHDGFEDILATSSGGQSTIYMNRGDGAFYQDSTFDEGYRTVAADYDSDGMTDVIAANWENIIIFQNRFENQHIYKANFGGDSLLGSNGDDKFLSSDGNDTFLGNGGVDTAIYLGVKNGYALTINSNYIDLSDSVIGRDGKDKLFNVSLIQFSDLTLDATSFAKTASLSSDHIESLIQLYIASFNRAPDSVGLNYWGGRYSDYINNVPDGMSLDQIAKSFFVQKETLAAYPDTMPLTDFVNTVYHNVLNRAADAVGFKYWVDELTNGHVSKDSFLLAIIYGAEAPSGASEDRLTLANKQMVGAYYALEQGLNNSTNWAKDVMSGVNSNTSTVTDANAKTDLYAAIAADPATSDLVVKLVGVYEGLAA